MSASKSQSGAIAEFDENFFSSIAVPKAKDYSRLSSSPSRDQPCDSSYFEKNYPNLECDTPVKMRLPSAQRESTDALPCPSLDMLSSSSSSESTVRHSEDQQHIKELPNVREPLKIVPETTTSSISTCTSSSTTSTATAYSENELIEGIEKMSMFAPKAPEERLSQRRRSEQKGQQPAGKTTATSRIRSISAKRSIQPVTAAMPVPPPRRHNSVTRTTSAPISSSGSSATATGVVTRSMAARAAEAAAAPPTAKSFVRRSVMPLKVAQKTPVAAVKDSSVTGGDRSRDRTRRSNTTNTSVPSVRGSVLSAQKPAAGARTPIAPPRRSASANRPASSSTAGSASRPIAHANRSSMLRMSAVKPTQPVSTANAKPAPPVGNRNRLPLRVNPATPTSAARKAAVTSGTRPGVVRQQPAVRAQSVERQKTAAPPVSAGTPRLTMPKSSRDDLFARLSTPKGSAAGTSARTSHDGPTSSIRKTAVRPVPSFIYNKTADGMPSSAGLHGIRAPSKERAVTPKK